MRHAVYEFGSLTSPVADLLHEGDGDGIFTNYPVIWHSPIVHFATTRTSIIVWSTAPPCDRPVEGGTGRVIFTIGARDEFPDPAVARLRQDQHMSDSARVEWAGAKIARAQQHRHDLVGRIAAWAGTSQPHPDASIAEDRLSYEVRVRMRHSPPLEEWSLILGDALHNLRSALDVLVWSLADPASLSGAQQRRVMWPVVVDP